MLKKRNALKLKDDGMIKNRLANEIGSKSVDTKKSEAKIRSSKPAKIKTETPSVQSGSQSLYQNLNQQIEALAYQYFVERGYEHGYDREDWIRAEREILSNSKKN